MKQEDFEDANRVAGMYIELDTSPESCEKRWILSTPSEFIVRWLMIFVYIYSRLDANPPVRGQETPGYDPPKKRLLGMWNPKDFNTGAQFETKWWLSNSNNTMASHPWICVYIYIHMTYLPTDWVIAPKWRFVKNKKMGFQPIHHPSPIANQHLHFTRKCSGSPYLGDILPWN